jgi:hypothetical protein
MKIVNLNVKGGQVNIADKIDKIEYNTQFGISSNEFELLIDAFLKLNQQQFEELKDCLLQLNKAKNTSEQKSFTEKAIHFIKDLGISFASSLTIDGLVQIGHALIK